MKFVFGALFIVISLIAVSQATTSQVALLDCEGNFFAFPKVGDKSAVAMNLENYFGMYNLVIDRYVDRFSCVCPSAKKAQILKLYNNVFGWALPGVWDNLFSENQIYNIPGCPFGNWNTYIPQSTPAFTLPATCNYQQSGNCLAYYEISNTVTFQVAVSECPNTNLPFVSVNCNGTGCLSLGLPCVSDSECGGALTCNPFLANGQPFPGNNPTTKQVTDTIMLSSPQTTDSCDNTMGNVNTLANHVRTVMYNRKPSTFKEIKYCGPGVLHAQTIQEDLNRTTNIFCPYGYPNSRLHMDCVKNGGPLKSWNGITNEGSYILNWKKQHPYTIPSSTPHPRTPGAVVILDITCDESFQVIPGSKFGASIQLKHIRELFNIAYDAYRNRLNCEQSIHGFKLDDAKFAANYFLPSFFAARTADEELWRSFYIQNPQTMAGYLFGADFLQTKFKFPKTCDWGSWNNDSKCEVTYDGLSSLLGIDIKINAAVKKCDYREYPNIYVECVGADCNMLNGLVQCDPNDLSTCPNAECVDPKELIAELSTVNGDRTPTDFIAQSLGFVTPQCPITNTTLLHKDVDAVMDYFGVSGHVCLPSIERIRQTINGWAQTQYYNSNGAIVLSDLGPWVSPPSTHK